MSFSSSNINATYTYSPQFGCLLVWTNKLPNCVVHSVICVYFTSYVASMFFYMYQIPAPFIVITNNGLIYIHTAKIRCQMSYKHIYLN